MSFSNTYIPFPDLFLFGLKQMILNVHVHVQLQNKTLAALGGSTPVVEPTYHSYLKSRAIQGFRALMVINFIDNIYIYMYRI